MLYGRKRALISATARAEMLILFTLISFIGHFGSANARAITTDDLVSIRDIKTIAVSPDGREVAYQVVQADAIQNNYDVSWHVVSTTPNAKPFTVARGFKAALSTNSAGVENGQLYTGEIIWSPDGDWIVYTAKRGDQVQLWKSKNDEYGYEQLTHNPANVEGPRFSSDGSTILFSTGRDRATADKLNSVQARQGYLIQDPPIYDVGMGPRWPPCRDRQERRSQEINDALVCDLNIWAFDVQTREERPATADEVEAYYSQPDTSLAAHVRRGQLSSSNKRMEIMSPDGLRAAWFENEDPGVFRGYAPPMRVAVSLGDQIVRCSLDECKSNNPSNIWWNSNGTQVLFLVRNGHNNTLTSLYSWTPDANTIEEVFSTDDMLYDCTKSDARLLCGHESWTSPRKIVAIDLASGQITTITDPNPEFQDFEFTKVEKILSTDALGNETHAHLVYPRDYTVAKRYPLVIVQYRSRGFLRGGTGDEHPIHVLAQYGFAVLSSDTPDDDYETMEGDSLALQTAYLRYLIIDRGPTTAIERIVDSLYKRGIIDSSRVGITGLSQGTITLESAILTRDYAAASASYSLSPSPVFEQPSTSFWGKAVNSTFGGTPYSQEGLKNRKKFSINWNAHRINTPFLIQVADREYHYAVQNYNALLDAKKPVEMHVFDNEYHVKWQPAHRLSVYNRNLDWFNFWLRGVEDGSPGKIKQYERWRTLRDLYSESVESSKSDIRADVVD